MILRSGTADRKMVDERSSLTSYVDASKFAGEYHGHRLSDLESVEPFLRQTVEGSEFPYRPIIWLAGDSSFDNKYWFTDQGKAVNGYESILKPKMMRKDVCYWLNRRAFERQLNIASINCAVEESSVGSRACCRLLPQDVFLRERLREQDYVAVSVGGNDIALKPSLCTIMHMLTLMKCSTAQCISSSCTIGVCPFDDYTCGCTTGCLSALGAFPCSYGYFVHLFKVRVEAYIRRLLGSKRPRMVLLCMIYYPAEIVAGQKSWADPTLSALGYNTDPKRLQTLIGKIFQDATSQVKIPGTQVAAVPLFDILNPTEARDYSQRVEPSAIGGDKIASYILDTISHNVTFSNPINITMER
jgi:hypothetical protein